MQVSEGGDDRSHRNLIRPSLLGNLAESSSSSHSSAIYDTRDEFMLEATSSTCLPRHLLDNARRVVYRCVKSFHQSCSEPSHADDFEDETIVRQLRLRDKVFSEMLA